MKRKMEIESQDVQEDVYNQKKEQDEHDEVDPMAQHQIQQTNFIFFQTKCILFRLRSIHFTLYCKMMILRMLSEFDQ